MMNNSVKDLARILREKIMMALLERRRRIENLCYSTWKGRNIC
jgi:hypothetical protein